MILSDYFVDKEKEKNSVCCSTVDQLLSFLLLRIGIYETPDITDTDTCYLEHSFNLVVYIKNSGRFYFMQFSSKQSMDYL